MSKTKRRTNLRMRSTGLRAGAKKGVTSKKTKRKKQIKTEEAYNATMIEIDKLMKKGEENLTNSQLDRLRRLAEAAESYEDTNDPLPLPDSIPEIVRMRMYAMRMTQTYAARILGVSDAKFSLIMNGKQKPDIYFIKAIHEKLKVDANMILRAI